jgi:hypothetical protein
VFVGGIACIYAARPKNMLDPRDLGNFPLRNVGAGLIIFGLMGLIIVGLLLAAGR